MNKYKKILDEIDGEINRAILKFPTWHTDPIHAAGVVAEEQGELTQAVQELVYEPDKTSMEEVRQEAVQVAAMAIRFIVSLDSGRYNWEPSDQHKQA